MSDIATFIGTIESNTKRLLTSGANHLLDNVNDIFTTCGVSEFSCKSFDEMISGLQSVLIKRRYSNAKSYFKGWMSKLIVFPVTLDFTGNVNYLFDGCTELLEVPEIDFKDATIISAIFRDCKKIKKIGRIESQNANGTHLFANCENLESIEYINIPSVKSFEGSFNGCAKLKEIRFEPDSIRCDAGKRISFNSCSELSAESIQSIFDGLSVLSDMAYIQFDSSGNNKTTYDAQFGEGSFDYKIDEARIKGWTRS